MAGDRKGIPTPEEIVPVLHGTLVPTPKLSPSLSLKKMTKLPAKDKKKTIE